MFRKLLVGATLVALSFAAEDTPEQLAEDNAVEALEKEDQNVKD